MGASTQMAGVDVDKHAAEKYKPASRFYHIFFFEVLGPAFLLGFSDGGGGGS